MKNKILIDVSLTGGRGPAKKVWEFTRDCKLKRIPYEIITDKQFVRKLKNLGIKPNYIVDTNKNENEEVIIQKFYDKIKNLDYNLMVKFGARVAGPIASRKLGKLYILIDGGLPDFLTESESLYERKTFEQAQKVLITTQFNWKLPERTELNNIEVVSYPLSQPTFELVEKVKSWSKKNILKKIESKVSGDVTRARNETLIDLVMTGDYLGRPEERVTYGGWLTTRQYDQSIGFVRRLITDIGLTRKRFSIFMDSDIVNVIQDLLETYSNLNILTFKNKWDFETEILMKAAADCTISRATNYQPYIALFEKGCNVTTPVPANGYMDEDTAGEQYAAKGLTKLIKYDDEEYVEKLIQFIRNKNEQEKVSSKLKGNKQFMINRNTNNIIFEIFKNVQTT